MIQALEKKFSWKRRNIPTTLKDSIWIFVNVRVGDLQFESEVTKEKLIKWDWDEYGIDLLLTCEMWGEVANSRMMKKINTWAELKKLNDLNQTKEMQDIPKLREALYAGTSDSGRCT